MTNPLWISIFANTVVGLGTAIVIISAVVGTSIVFALVSGPWWPTTLVQFSYRKRQSIVALLQSTMLLVIPIVISGGDGAAAGLLIYFIGAPRYVNWRVRVNSWKADDELTRERAWMIRNRLRDRIGEPMVELEDRPWVEYVNDVVRCRRDEAYELPTKVSD